MKSRSARPLLCLAASGGGHVRQLLDLEPLWRNFDYYFVTEDTALGQSISKQHRTEFVPHFALGQAKLGQPLKMLREAGRSMWQSLSIICRNRPDYVITTGAGSQLFIAFWARLIGAKIILIDSFARFDSPSAFARLAGPIAHLRLSQSAASARNWGNAQAFDPLRYLPVERPAKDDLVFATVGATLPFPRLVDLVIEAKRSGRISERVILQVGDVEGELPAVGGVEVVRSLPFDEVQQTLERARIVICHGGTGSILTALRASCAVIVIPRLFAQGEHYDDHQLEITGSFEQRGLLRSATNGEELAEALEWARDFEPRPVTTDYSEMIEALRDFIKSNTVAPQEGLEGRS
ncbi:glycosyltransferase [Aurantiacibacter sp. MUD11]|uniref:beta-1,4-glucuronosyltransferase WelK n=1 Tax=Aurantiacibacter sp. MUD11 TaxID=3003265 RepID=UPI0022AB3F87|nr:glycosyltransferase [Aurantiacibacter sp. MUD11]WAT17041.1 glycosyltransferase [Aurantiacibacter sp. MUD11]